MPPITKTPEHQSLRVHSHLPLVRDTLGPGARMVVWVQGCKHRCPGCMMPESWDPTGGASLDPITLSKACLSREVEGITVSGGEPFDQPEAVTTLLHFIKQHGRNTWVYTGYTLEELVARNEPVIDRLLAHCDVLVDGPYQEGNRNCLPFRGSSNQRIIHLTKEIAEERINSFGKVRVDLTLDSNGRLIIVGIPPRGFLKTLKIEMARRGLIMIDINLP